MAWVQVTDEEVAQGVFPPPAVYFREETGNRNGLRVRLDDQAFVLEREHSRVIGAVREMSISGALVTRTDAHIKKNDKPIEFILSARRNHRPIELRVLASIVRAEQDYLTVKFRYYDNFAYTQLVNILYVDSLYRHRASTMM